MSGLSGQSAMLSYAETNWWVSYWLSTGGGMRKSSEGTTLPTGNIWVRKLSPKACRGKRVAVRREAQCDSVAARSDRSRAVACTASSTIAPSDKPIAVPGPPLRIAASRLPSPSSTDSPMLGAVDTQAWKAVVQPADAREHPFQGVALNLTRGVVDDLPIQSGEPVRARAPDVLVIGNAQNVRAAQRVRRAPASPAAVARCLVPRGLASSRLACRRLPRSRTRNILWRRRLSAQ